MEQHPLGAVNRDGPQPSVRLERRLRAAPEAVWRLLTEPSELAGWLRARVELEPRTGGSILIHFQNTQTTIRGEIARYEEPTTLEYTWQGDDDVVSAVCFELEERAGGTLLIVTHSRLTDNWLEMVGAGWHTHLELLAEQLAGRPFDWDEHRFNELRAQYAAMRG